MKIKKFINRNGFTLVELLVAVSVLGVLGVVITSVLVQSLKGEKKVQILNQTKQNAQLVLERIIQEVQSTSSIYCVGDADPDPITKDKQFGVNSDPTKDTLVLMTIDSTTGNKTYNRYRFFNEDKPNNKNGYITFDTATEPDPALSCDPLGSFPSSPQVLTDQDPNTGISLTYYGDDFASNVFWDDPQSGAPDAVTIKFRANAGVNTQGLFDTSTQQNGETGIGFGSTATVRNELN